MPARRRDPVSMPRVIPSSYVRHDYGIDDTISRMGNISNAVLADTYDASAKSKARDNELLRSANSAIISTDLHSSPRAAAVSRRVRASSVPPVTGQQARAVKMRPVYNKVAGARPYSIVLVPAQSTTSTNHYNTMPAASSKPAVMSEREVPWLLKARAGSVPPRAKSGVVENSNYQPVVGTEGLKAHNPRLIRSLRARSVGPVPIGKGNQASARPASMVASVRPSRMTASARASSVGRSAHPTGSSVMPRAMAQDLNTRIDRLARSMSEPRDISVASHMYPHIPDVKQRALSRYLYAHRGRFGTDSKPRRSSLADFPLVYVPKTGPGPSNRAKAAIIGSRMEAEDNEKKKSRPRSSYAAAKYRETRKEPTAEDAIYYNTISNSSLQSSRPPLPKVTERKAIRDVDGFTKPKNVMSWQYRTESRLSPDDLIHTPPTLSRMRDRIREAQEKMDRHRQLLDRYLDKDTVASASSRKDDVNRGPSPRYYK